MTALRDELRALLASFDDDALAALASRGLLRRAAKDLERSPAAIAEETADCIVVAVADQRVRLDRGGPAQAKCTCPATTTCQHVLAATIALQRLLAAGEPAPPGAAVLHDSLMAIGAEELQAHAGKAGWRWAVQFALDFDVGRHLRTETRRSLVITLQQPHLVAHYPGGGVAALVLDGKLAHAEKHRAAIVLVYQRAHGAAIAPAEPGAAHQGGLDLGADFTPATAGAVEVAASRARLRAACGQLAQECLGLGLAHLSPHVQQRFETLAVWARGVEYHRLARLLRRIADHVELLQQRAGGADEHRLLDELTLVFALASALGHHAAANRAPVALVGRARSRFADAATLDVLGLGARTFRSPTGYVGLTMLFWSPAEGEFLACTDARPIALRGFDPIARYRQPGPWAGLGAPQQATGRLVTLTAARRDDNGRLSAIERTSAIVRPAGDAFAQLPAVHRWSELDARVDEAVPASLLGEQQPLRQWAFLAPAAFGEPVFDALRQVLVWPLADAGGATIAAELAWSPANRAAIERVERLLPAATPAGTIVVAQLRRTGAAVIAEPLSLVRAGAEQPVDCLHFDPPAAGQAREAARAVARAVAPETPAPPERSSLPAALRPLQAQLRQLAERGVPPDAAGACLPGLDALLARAIDSGLTVFRRAPPAGAPAVAEVLMQTNYVVMQYERVLSPPDGDA